MITMANNLPDILKAKGWSIYKLHKATGLTYNTVHPLVKAKEFPDGIEYGTVKKIARALGVKIDDLENG